MAMNKTNHAKIRQQQRGVTDKAIDLLWRYGKLRYQKGGTGIVYFPKNCKNKLEKNNINIKNLKHSYMVIDTIESTIVTVGYAYKKIRNG